DFYDPERQNLSASLYADENIPETDPTTDIVKPNARIGQEAAAQRDSDRQNDRKVRGLVGVLAFVARGLQRVSGRKTVFLMSDGLPLQAIGPNGRLSTGDQWQQMLELIDMANRASIVFNTIDIRGVVNPDIISANDDFT